MSYFLLSWTNNPKIGSHDIRHNKWSAISSMNNLIRTSLYIIYLFLIFQLNYSDSEQNLILGDIFILSIWRKKIYPKHSCLKLLRRILCNNFKNNISQWSASCYKTNYPEKRAESRRHFSEEPILCQICLNHSDIYIHSSWVLWQNPWVFRLPHEGNNGGGLCDDKWLCMGIF